jgi:hypothetical protein
LTLFIKKYLKEGKEMQKPNKLSANKLSIIAILLMLSLAIPIFTLPAASASEYKTVAYIVANPNPVGVNQPINVIMWAGIVLPSASVSNDIRWHDYKLVITDPDGKTETKTWPIVEDTTSTQFLQYIPTKAGTYSFVFSYPDLNYTWSGTYRGTIFLGATSKVLNVTVQDEPVPDPITSYPLPNEYWTRPIEGQNTDWWAISSHWLGYSHPKHSSNIRFQPDGLAPNSAHILWTKSIDEGGVVGGTGVGIDGNMYYSGMAYNARFTNPLILNGRLFYPLPNQNSGTGGGYMAVDLLTGEELWFSKDITSSPTFGYLYGFNSENQHGAIPPGLLFTNNFARGYHPLTGENVINVTGVPSGVSVLGPQGEIIRYVLTNLGSASNPNYYLAAWNSSRVVWPESGTAVGQSATANAGTPDRYDWNVSLSKPIPQGTSAQLAIFDDILIGSSSFASFGGFGTPDPFTFWAISLKPESRGTLLWSRNYSAPEGNVTIRLPTLDEVNRQIIWREKETMVFQALNIDNGDLTWKTKTIAEVSDWEYFDPTFSGQFFMPAYGNLYHAGVGGAVYCYDGNDGSLLWVNGIDKNDPKNSTYSGLATAWGVYPQYIHVIADGKVYVGTGEHSPDSPLWKGAKVRCLNATTGEELWSLSSYLGFPGRVYVALADGVFVYDDLYNHQITAIGKGPSALTVEAPMTSNKLGDSVVIRGTIIDTSAGTKQNEQAARFPNGVPAVSDESQAAWMEYVYKQKPRPTDITGVEVMLSVVDSNGNYRPIGTATSDADGFFTYSWKPDIEGTYIVYATFAGSESYWPSHDVTSFVVDPAPATPTPQPTQAPSAADLYFIPAVAGLFVAIIAVGLLTMLMLKKRP